MEHRKFPGMPVGHGAEGRYRVPRAHIISVKKFSLKFEVIYIYLIIFNRLSHQLVVSQE